MKNYLVTALALGLSACGGGGGGGSESFLSFDKAQLVLQGFSEDIAVPKAKFIVTAKEVIKQPASLQVLSTELGISKISITQIDDRSYGVDVVFDNNLSPGTHNGFLDVKVCKDNAASCAQFYGDGPSRLPYSLKVSGVWDGRPLKQFADINWSGSFGDSTNSSYIDAALDTANITKRWEFKMREGEQEHQLRAFGGKIFVLSTINHQFLPLTTHSLKAFDERDGRMLWMSEDNYSMKFSIDNGEITITDDGQQIAYKIDPETGGNNVVQLGSFVDKPGRVESIEPYANGYLAAYRPAKPDYWSSSVDARNSIIYKTQNGGGWKSSGYYTVIAERSNSPSTFLKTESTVYAPVIGKNNEHGIVALSAKDGSEKFFARVQDFYVDAPLFLAGNNICSTSELLTVSCFDKETGQVKWSLPESGVMFSASAQSLLVTDGEFANWRNANTGELEYSWGTVRDYPVKYNDRHSLMFKDVAIVGSPDRLVTIKKGSKDPLWAYNAPTSHLAVSQNGVLFAISAGRLIAFNLQ